MDKQHVFLNGPFEKQYEPLFISLIAGVVCLGLTPRCVVEIAEHGHGRIARLQELIASCGSSIHDLSKVNTPVRFNMPFELGLACALQNSVADHNIIVLEQKPYRIQKTLSDYNGRDPIIHNGSRERLILGVLDAFDTENPPRPRVARRILRLLIAATREIKKEFGVQMIFSKSVFKEVVATATFLALSEGVISPN